MLSDAQIERIQTQFAAAQARPDLATSVALARTVLREALYSNNLDLDEVFEHAETLAGKLNEGRDVRTIAWDDYCRLMSAAYVLGIAAGQLLHPDVFAKGGAR